MTEATQRWDVGRARITSVVESQFDRLPPSLLFADADEATILRHPWLAPHYADERGRVSLRVQAFVIEAGGRVVVVDPCVGNGKRRAQPFWNEQSWPFMERFRAAGFDPEAVELVVHTHLHVDHLGWDTHRADGRWVPTFTRARHLYVAAEVDAQAAEPGDESARIRADSIEPIFAAGLADIVEPDADLGGGLRLAPTTGHTAGHVALWLDGGGDRPALISGDTLHHPVQCAELDLDFSDADPVRAQETRRGLLAAAADTGALVLGAHFPNAPGGVVLPGGDAGGWRFAPLAAEV